MIIGKSQIQEPYVVSESIIWSRWMHRESGGWCLLVLGTGKKSCIFAVWGVMGMFWNKLEVAAQH